MLTPDNSRVNVTKINDHIYLMDDANVATGYLVIGNEKALVIDTMIGFANVREIAERYTELPLMVVNTHGHSDHIFGNIYFDEAYMNPDDWDVATEAVMDPKFVEETKAAEMSMPPFKDIHPGDVIDLGGLHLDIIGLAGHTPGSVLLLLKEDRILFTGDAINHQLWMQIHHATSLKLFRENLAKIMYLKDEADHILHGHAKGLDDISLMEKTLLTIDEMLAGNTDGEEKYTWFGGKGLTHPIVDDDGVICFNPVSENVKRDRVLWAQSDAARDEGLKEPDTVKAYKDISYGLFGEHSLLDVYVPVDDVDFVVKNPDGMKKLPVLINVHGGGYFYGDKELYRFYSMDMARYGFIVINFNYRLVPEYRFPSPVQDINNVIRWIEEHADEYGMDTSRVFMMGDSAGAQLTSHYAAINSNPDFAKYYALKPTTIKLKGLSLACGMYDIPQLISGATLDECVQSYLGEFNDFTLPMLDVVGAITSDYPATFIFSCPNDFLYPACEPMYKLLCERGVKARMEIYGTKEMKDVAHVFHCNMKTEIGAKARRDQAEYLLSL